MTQPCSNSEPLPTFIAAPGASRASATGAFLMAVDILEELPKERDVLVGLFKDLGLRGVQGSGEHCVLAEYVRHIVWPEDDVELAIMAGVLYVGHADMEHTWTMPEHLTDFTVEFDRGDHPRLSIMDSGAEE